MKDSARYYSPFLLFSTIWTTILVMKEKQSSITAAGIAIVRAVESEKPEGMRICFDPYAARFLNPWFLIPRQST